MDATAQYSAWLQSYDGKRTPIEKTCSLGRSVTNAIVLANEKISRNHALIHPQGNGEFWLVDCGSANGTRLNGRRVISPTPLRDSDEIEIGGIRLRFRSDVNKAMAASMTAGTVREMKTEECWLLFADVVSSTDLMKGSTADFVPSILGKWLLQCKQTVESNGGAINKFLGDGFLAYWSDRPGVAEKFAAALRGLQALQAAAEADFRIIAHFGPVLLGGLPTNNEDSLFGQEVNFIFRMEKLAAAMKIHRFLSEALVRRLDRQFSSKLFASHPVQGFEGTFPFFTF
jgi:class 3 adenylate cyclase